MNLLFALLFLSLPGDLSLDRTVVMERGVEYVGARAPARAAPGEAIELELYFSVDGPLSEDVSNFLHLEGKSSSECRVVHDREPTNYRDGVLVHEVEVRMPDDSECAGIDLGVYTGFYETDTQRRFVVEGLTVPDNRIPAATIELVHADQDRSAELVSFSPADIHLRQFFDRVQPWWGWLGGLLAVLALVFGLRRFLARRVAQRDEGEETTGGIGEVLSDGFTESVADNPWWVRAGPFLVAAAAVCSILAALNFVKDDAYISFRYAHNLVTGEGLVFNPGEYVEGFTNFAWVLVLAPFEGLGLDLFQVTEILGTGLILGLLVVMTRVDDHLFGGVRRGMARLWAPLLVATSSSVALWATSGMEQPLAMFLPVASAFLLWTSWDDPDASYRAAASGILIGFGCMTRPEIHLIGILLGLPLVWRMIRERRLDRIALYWMAGLLAITVPFHLFRLWYYGSLLPNTFYVKTGGSAAVLLEGLRELREMFGFNHFGFVALSLPLAFLDRRNLREKGSMLGVAVGFMAYVVWVGEDEMSWYRLYLPALPFLALLAGLGLRNLCASVAVLFDWRGRRRLGVFLVGWVVVLAVAGSNFAKTYDHKGGFNGRGSLSGSYHPDIGKFLTRHARSGSLVAFQDMGSTPYHAPDLRFLDFIGLVDETVARARHRHGLHAFVSTGTPEEEAKYNAEMREYFWERSPDWVILTTYIPDGRAGEVSRAFSTDPGPEPLEPWIGQNDYQFGIYGDRFKRNYRHVRTWPRSSTYYLSVFRRADLWERTPGEVVIGDAEGREVGPEEWSGVSAEFGEGLELLGSKIESEVTEGHHFLVTTWWRLPGPMREDLNLFVHAERPGFRAPFDHIPGDWLYPADRWKAGEIIEERTLFQLPPGMGPGEYEVYIGGYFRGEGRRLEVRRGPDDGEDRVKLGTVRVVPFRPWLDHLIQPTNVETMRKYPERIVDHRN